MTRLELVEELEKEGLLIMDGYDDCILGLGRRFDQTFVVYDQKKVIAKLMSEGMTEQEAWEYHDYNQVGAYMGEGTVAFVEVFDKE